MSIDPIKLAQFMVLPGASELIEAFAALPPGPVRDSVVNHAQVLAQASGWGGPVGPMVPHPGEAQGVVARHTPPRLPSPFAANLAAQSQDGQIVERALRGEDPDVIAADLDTTRGRVGWLMDKARREGGVVFPGDDKRKSAPKQKQGVKLSAAPLPKPPYWWEDAASPIWTQPNLLPSLSEKADGSIAGVGPHDTRSYAVMTIAAERRGMTLRRYIAWRLDLVTRVAAGEEPSVVARRLGMDTTKAYALLRKVGQGWMDKVVGDARRAEAETPPQPAAPPPVAPYAEPRSDVAMGPERWGFPDLESLEAARVKVREIRQTGVRPQVVAATSGLPYKFVVATLQLWAFRGHKFPPAINLIAKKAAGG